MEIVVCYKGLNKTDILHVDQHYSQTQLENFLQMQYNVDFNAFQLL